MGWGEFYERGSVEGKMLEYFKHGNIYSFATHFMPR